MTLRTPTMLVAAFTIAACGPALAQSQPEKGAQSQAAKEKTQQTQATKEKAKQSQQAAEEKAKQAQTAEEKTQKSQAAKEKAKQSQNGKEKSKQSQAANKKSKKAEITVPSGIIIKQQKPSETRVSNIIGMTVKNGAGKKAEEIGTIGDVILNENRKVVAVLINVSGFLGISGTNYGVARDALQINEKAGFAVVDLTQKQLEKAPAYMTLQEQKEKQKEKRQQQKLKKKMKQQHKQQKMQQQHQKQKMQQQ